MPLTSIKAVIDSLDRVIDEAVANNSKEAYFAYVYRYTTAAVWEAIREGVFEDNERMEQFDVFFAQLYLDAHSAFHRRESCPSCWAMAFECDQRSGTTILQHISLGMNAHINLDLGVAAGRMMRGRDITALEADFNKVNDVLQEIIDGLQDKVARVSPLLGWVDWLAARLDERAVDVGMRSFRGRAWLVAQKVWEAGPEKEAEVLQEFDDRAVQYARRVLHPPTIILRGINRLAARLETRSVAKVIQALRED